LDLHECSNDQLLIGWWTDLATNIQYVIFLFMGKHYQLYKKCPFIRIITQVTRDDWTMGFEAVKVARSHVIVSLIVKFERQFPNHDLMNATCIIYLQYWSNPHVDEMF